MNHVLIVDDADSLRNLFVSVLKAGHFSVLGAGSGQEALDMIQTDPPALILLDYSMKPMNGVEFLQRLRADPRFAATPVVLLTATTDPSIRAAAEKYNVQGYLLKSGFPLSELIGKVRGFVNTSETPAGPRPPV